MRPNMHLGEDDLVIRISDFHVHPNLRAAMNCQNVQIFTSFESQNVIVKTQNILEHSLLLLTLLP